MNNLMFTIITVCYNSEKTIRKTLESVLNQSFQDYEYIIVDGNSTDSTLNILDQYKELFADKLTVISEPDDGIYDAMNKGIGMARGQLIGLVNSDDYYEKNTLELAANAIDNQKRYQVIYGFQRCLNNGQEEKIVFFNHNFLDKQMITHPTCFVSKNVYDDFGAFNLNYRSSSDYEFMLRLFHSGKITFTPVYEIMSNFETGGMSSSEISVRETAKLHLNYNTISLFGYYKIMIRSYIHNFLKLFSRKNKRKK